MHAQAACGLGDIEAGLGQGLVNMLPFQRLDGGGLAADLHVGAAFDPPEGGFDIVGIRGLGQAPSLTASTAVAMLA